MDNLKIVALLVALSWNATAEQLNIAVHTGEEANVYMSIGSESTQFEMLMAYSPSIGIKHSFKLTNELKLWAGIGAWSINKDLYDSNGIRATGDEYLPVIFIELEHESGAFIRAFHYEGILTATTSTKEFIIGTDKITSVTNYESITKQINENKVVVGYKWHF